MKLEVKDLSFSYGSNHVLKGMDFTVDDGEMTFLLGQNGAGKSTLFKCILAHQRAKSGQILIDGEPVNTIKPRVLAKKIAYIPQANAPTFNYSVRQIVVMGRTVHLAPFSSPGEKDDAMVDDALQKLGIFHLADKGFGEISGGERQLVLIARALVQEGAIMLMDEPTSNLDYGNQLRVMERVKSLTAAGKSILVSSHNPEHALLFGNRVLAMHDGRVISEGAPADVLTPELVDTLYGVGVTIENGEKGRVIYPDINNLYHKRHEEV